MSAMFWVWLIVILITAGLEFATMEVVSIWFTIGAIIPFILAATEVVGWEVQLLLFILISAILIVSLRKITKKFLLRNSNEKTNLDIIIGNSYRLLSKIDFETMGTIKINDIIWNATSENKETIEKDEIVEVVKISGNKLIVKKSKETTENKNDNK